MPRGGAGQSQEPNDGAAALVHILVSLLTRETDAAAAAATWGDACAACERAAALLTAGPLPQHSVTCALLHCAAAEYAARAAQASPGGVGGTPARAAMLSAMTSVMHCGAALQALEQRNTLVPLPVGMDRECSSTLLLADAARAQTAAGDSSAAPLFSTGREGEFAGAVCSLRLGTLCLGLAAALYGRTGSVDAAAPPLEALVSPAARALRCIRPAHLPCCTGVREGIAYEQQPYVCFGPLPHAEAKFAAALTAALPVLPATSSVVSLRAWMSTTPPRMEQSLLNGVAERLACGATLLAEAAATGAGIHRVYRKEPDTEPVRVSSRMRARGQRTCAAHGCDARESWPGQFRSCSRCRTVAYCGEPCHVTHWRAGHKRECAAMAAAAAAETGAAH